MSFPRTVVIAGALTSTLILASACSSSEAKVRSAQVERTTTTTTTTTAPPPPAAPAVIAPLTGLDVVGDEAASIGRPALAVKVDNAPPALPQDGLNRTDVVIEVMVESISRLMAVYHSHDAGSIGPTRSARHSDPDLLALFGRPLFGWSGANEEVTGAVLTKDWIVNVEWNRVQHAYARRGGRRAPHNLYTSTAPLFARAKPDQGAPAPIFDLLAPGEPAAGGPVPGVHLTIGATDSRWVWDPALGRWGRWQYGAPHRTDDGQVTAANVVILQTGYAAGPTARSTGSGRAWVLSGGNIVEGTWHRPARTDRYQLVGLDGVALKVSPGNTWIELPPTPPSALDGQTAAMLLAGPR